MFNLKSLSLPLDLTCSGREFQTFGLRDYKLLFPNATWFGFGTGKNKKYSNKMKYANLARKI
jgi:hypothetical protein